MSYFLIDNFAAGLDLRRSAEMAVAGSLRRLDNAYINEGGEIEKRKAFVKEETLTAYGQTAAYKNRITGPHAVPGYPGAVFFRHRNDSLPGSFTAGGGSIAAYHTVGDGYNQQKFWVAKSTVALTNFGALMHAGSYSEFSSNGYVVESHVDNVSGEFRQDHVYQSFTDDEPTSEAEVTANQDRAFQLTLQNKGYVVEGGVLYASAVGTPQTMTGTGSGSLNLSTQGRSIGRAIALADYYGQLAVFGRRGIQFYSVDPDFAATQYQRRIEGSVFAPRSIVGYGDGDVIFLARNGVRSLQARDSSNLAQVTDLGSPIDRAIKADLNYLDADDEPIFSGGSPDASNADFYNLAKAIVHPETGQLWVCLRGKVYVFSRFPASRVQAWSSFELPQPATANLSPVNGPVKSRWVADIEQVNETIVLRNFADEVYVYGGASGESFDDSPAIVETPFIDMGTPGDNKYFTGLDLVCEGYWEVEASTRPVADGMETPWFRVAEVNGRTRGDPRVSLNCQGTQIALRLTCRSPYAARLAQIGIFFKKAAEK